MNQPQVVDGLAIIGRAERVVLLDHGDMPVPAKVDTGADSSSIWASDIHRDAATGELRFALFAPGSDYYTGNIISLPAEDYRQTRVSSSFGHREIRYVVRLRIKLLGKTIRATFTLADRSTRTYPILLGRRLLKNKFVVDVSKGSPLLADEKAKRDALRVALNELED